MRAKQGKIPGAHRIMVRGLRHALGFPYIGAWKGRRDGDGGKLCIFAHWDPHGEVDDYVLHYLGRLVDHGFLIDFVTTSPDLRPRGIHRLKEYCRRILLRRNDGMDFASWKAAHPDPHGLAKYDSVLLANDSVFGPFHDLGPHLERLASTSATIWGMTDSFEQAHHIQSYFLGYPGRTIASELFATAWSDINPDRTKDEVIMSSEVGISQMFLNGGGILEAAYPYSRTESVLRSRGSGFQYWQRLAEAPLNTTLFAWDVLIGEFGFPFIKTEILKTNRFESRSVKAWRDYIPDSSKNVIPMMEKYLRRVSPLCPGMER